MLSRVGPPPSGFYRVEYEAGHIVTVCLFENKNHEATKLCKSSVLVLSGCYNRIL